MFFGLFSEGRSWLIVHEHFFGFVPAFMKLGKLLYKKYDKSLTSEQLDEKIKEEMLALWNKNRGGDEDEAE